MTYINVEPSKTFAINNKLLVFIINYGESEDWCDNSPYLLRYIIRNILLNRLIIILVVVTFFVLGCSRQTTADPMCRINAQYQETPSSPAACVIKSNGKLLAIKNHDDDGWNLPHHKQQKSTSAQCTAHRAVWKTTGLNVEVGKLLFTGPSQIQYFACKLTDDYSSQLRQFPVPSWAKRKTNYISLVNPFETEQDQWINDINLIKLREVYNQLE